MSVQAHHYQQLTNAFDGSFADTLNTRLIKGDEEPLYLPADDAVPYHRIIFAHGYYASALNEIAHWCIAGARRRLLADFATGIALTGAMPTRRHGLSAPKSNRRRWSGCFASLPASPFMSVAIISMEIVILIIFYFSGRVHAQVMSNLGNGVVPRPAAFIQTLHRYYHTPPLAQGQFPFTSDFNE